MKLVRWIGALATGFALLAGDLALARPGDLDPTFSRDGFAQVDLTSKLEPGGSAGEDQVQLVGAGPAGDVVLAANTTYSYDCVHVGCARYEFFVAVARFVPNGDLDTGFAGDGTFEGDFGLPRVRAAAYALQRDGKALIAGSTYSTEGDLFVARLNADGTPDESFAADGVMTLNLPDFQQMGDLVLAPDGRIVVGGSTTGAEFQPGFFGGDDLLFRLLADGTLDPSFGGGDGLVTFDLARLDDIDEVAIDGENRIVAAGPSGPENGHETTTLIRLASDGSLDPGFSDDGWTLVDLAPERFSIEQVSALVTDTESRSIVSISSVAPGPGISPYRRALVRFGEGGSPDPGFGTDGKAFLEDIPGASASAADPVRALGIDGEGRMLIAGGPRLLVGRRLTDGSPDPSFANRGWLQIDPQQGAYSRDLLVAPDGRIVVGGATQEGIMRAQVARIRTDDDPPDDLDADGIPDTADPCPSVFFEGGACPSYPRSVTIRRTRTKVHGSLKSAAAECLNGAVVRLIRKRPGPDRRAWRSAPVTEPSGIAYSGNGPPLKAFWPEHRRPVRPGRYYALIKRSLAPTGAECGEARSRIVRLRSPRD